MAYESNMNLATIPGTTGISQYRGVIVNSAGRTVYPSAIGQSAPIGVTQNASTATDAAVTVALPGSITKLEFAGSTLSAGDRFSFNTAGRGCASTGFSAAGWILSGSSGSTGRILTVLLQPGQLSST